MWFLNVFLYLVFWACTQSGDFTPYQALKDSGIYPCHGWVFGGVPDTPPPPCFYDPGAY